eukprot:TRINITY_DN27620_c0_g1_i1.p1 TRINITY_DN27620_c0_g1~~TRINITY_DN27620_c0_g1_i1.p1  ORF type:complete len:612 (+),score=106.27 TRINITY_DN27620_c0_g1_i1:237-2072(+)
MTVLVPGFYSQVGRSTEHELQQLAKLCGGTVETQEKEAEPEAGSGYADGEARRPRQTKAADAVFERLSRTNPIRTGGGKSQKRNASKERTASAPQGELARIIQARVQHNIRAAADAAESDTWASYKGSAGVGGAGETAGVAIVDDKEMSCFKSQGIEAGWTSKFTAMHDVGALNRRQEHKPDPGWYRMHYQLVHHRTPAWDFGERPRTMSRAAMQAQDEASRRAVPEAGEATGSRPSSNAGDPGGGTTSDGAFLTGVSLEDPSDLHCAENSPQKESKQTKTAMALATERPELRKVGRVPVHGHEVSLPSDSLLQQDIKTDKFRAPEWNFSQTAGRKASAADSKLPPGKYDYNLDIVGPRAKVGMSFERQLQRDVCVRNLGYSAPPRVLHPDEDRTQKSASTLRGPMLDRSLAKDAVRSRVTNVRDMSLDLERPVPTSASQEYHDKRDPEVCDGVLQRSLAFDPEVASAAVRKRQDVAPDFRRMLPRGRSAVQGVRSLQGDTAVRGSVGFGFAETTGQLKHNVDVLEARKVVGPRADVVPTFEKYTRFQSLDCSNNYNHGYPKVHRFGLDSKVSPLRNSKSLSNIERKAGQTSQRSRSYVALPEWGFAPLPE